MKRLSQCFVMALLAGAAGCSRIGGAIQAAIRESAAATRPHPAGTVHEDIVVSQALGVAKHVAIYLPPSYGRDSTRRYPVAYYLHGLLGTEADWLSRGGIDAVADSIFDRGAAEMIIVMPDGDDGWWTTWSDQVSYRACADSIRNESASRYCVQRARYDEYVARDVVRHVDSTYRTRADRDNRGVAGLSMGGYGAVAIALRYPDVFGAAASHSGVLSPLYTGPKPFAAPARYASTVEEARAPAGIYFSRYLQYWGRDIARWRSADPATMAAEAKRRGVRMPAIFFDCGRDDGFIDQNRAFDAELTRLGVPHRYAEWPGAHSWRYWSEHLPQSLAWMAREID